MSNSARLRPTPGRQSQFLASKADITIYGGAAGGGKSYGLLLEGLRQHDKGDASTIYFRRTRPDITGTGGIWERTKQIFPAFGGVPNETGLTWRFPSTYLFQFSQLQYEDTKLDHQSAEYEKILWDELTHFTKGQFWYLRSRNRTPSGRKPIMRAGCNPDSESFVKELILPWLDEETRFPNLAVAGEIRYMVRDKQSDAYIWWHLDPNGFKEVYDANKKEDPYYKPTSVSFIPASLDDNPYLLKSGYKATLLDMPLVERQQLLYGDWLIRPAAGNVFKRAWFQMAYRIPELTALVRYWDRAGTSDKPIPGKKKSKDPDYTAGVLMGQTVSGQWIILDLVHFRGSSLEVEQKIYQTAVSDREQWGSVLIGIEQDPGSAGKFESETYVRKLAGFDARIFPARQDKITRARPFSAQVEAGNVLVYQADWNEKLFRELEGFPDAAHDDIVDGCSGAFNAFGEVNIMAQASFWEQLGDII